MDVVEDWGIRFTGLEVERTVLRLQDHVVAKLAVEVSELRDSLFHTILTLMLGAIDERAPHDDATERFHRIGQCVGTVGMGAVIVEGTRLSLRVGLHKETAEVGNLLVDLLGLSFPPSLHRRIQRVGSLQCLSTVDALHGNGHR